MLTASIRTLKRPRTRQTRRVVVVRLPNADGVLPLTIGAPLPPSEPLRPVV